MSGGCGSFQVLGLLNGDNGTGETVVGAGEEPPGAPRTGSGAGCWCGEASEVA